MEFKGTKGRWKFEMSNGKPSVIDAEDYCLVDFFGLNEKDTYDALLISKAPQMLEMLIMINEGIHTMDFTQLEILQPEIEQLIQSATEI